MAGLSKEARLNLLEALRLDAGQADVSSDRPDRVAADFYPIAEHLRAIEPDVVLIVGDRGAGKTKLKTAVTDNSLRDALVKYTPGLRAPDGNVSWYDAWPLRRKGPDSGAWTSFASAHKHDREVIDLWAAYLVRVLEERLDGEGRAAMEPLIRVQGGDAEACFNAYSAVKLSAMLALDRLDEHLEKRGEWVFLAYDELDTIVFADWEALGSAVRSLVSFWASYARRWSRIRPKIFMRTDFYAHNREIAGADIAKLSANRVELAWNDKNLYGALLKHIANKSEELLDYVRKVVSVIDFHQLGHIPKLARATDALPFVTRLVGDYMGANSKKGAAFTWILDHLRDGNGRVSPRRLVWLLEFAAAQERKDPKAVGNHLLHPVSLRNALDDVSVQHVDNANSSELRWLRGLEARLKVDREVPWTRKELERLLAIDFEKSWSTNDEVRPPGQDIREVFENLIELGVIRVRSADSFDVPDLYLAGLKLRRKGGVRKH
ncbi:hypothetical protein [Pendulispora albinea]|uniref:Uncharacterized protein n=1 Tax=Pendulispora albinea TaxID=2741071 RepID=A0ABZ2LW40_9BACT